MIKKLLLFVAIFLTFVISMASCDFFGNNNAETEHVHTYSDWVVTKEASCSVDGIQTRICDSCDKTQTLPIIAEHSWSKWVITKDATCAEEGLKERVCGSCQAEETDVIEMLPLHPWGEWITIEAATCTEDGERKRACTSCGETKIETVAATSHSWGDWTTVNEATCNEEGERERVCSACELKESETVAIRSHLWSNWTTLKKATCAEEGAKERTCSLCELKESENIAMRSHSWSAWTTVTSATCTEDGFKERACSSCEKKEVEVIAAAHSFLDGVCSTCNATVINNIIIPEAPLTLNWHEYTTITITSLRIEIYKSGSTEYVRIYFDAEKTYDKNGANSTNICAFNWKLYDSNGYVFLSGSETYNTLTVGDKFIDNISLGKLSELDPNETYTLVFTDYN